jgi:hypothetical protein
MGLLHYEYGADKIIRARCVQMTDLDRYEILLPLKFNDGRAVPRDLLAATRG